MNRRWAKKRLPGLLTPLSSAGLLPLAGCNHAPEFNVLGSYFPAWLLCIGAGVALSGLSYAGLKRAGLDREIVASIVVYPCLALLFACALWLLLFR